MGGITEDQTAPARERPWLVPPADFGKTTQPLLAYFLHCRASEVQTKWPPKFDGSALL